MVSAGLKQTLCGLLSSSYADQAQQAGTQEPGSRRNRYWLSAMSKSGGTVAKIDVGGEQVSVAIRYEISFVVVKKRRCADETGNGDST